MQDVCPHGHPTLGYQVLEWMEHYLVHGPGDVQGDPLGFDDEISRFVVCAYAMDSTGRRMFDQALLSRPKGRAKTELAAAIVCAEALGPVRFDGWDAEGEPVAAPVTYPFIRCLATEEDQSGNTYGAAAFMLSEDSDSEAFREFRVDLGRDWQSSTRIFLPGGGEIRPSTAASASKDGGKETFAVADEPHLYVLPENRRMYDTVFRNMAKRKKAAPWMLSTSTMFAPGQDSTAERLHAAKDNPRLLLDHRGARRHVEFDDEIGLRAELAYVYGDGWSWMDQERLLSAVRDDLAEEADRRRYFLNEPWKGSNAWLDVRDWMACKEPKPVESGEAVTLGFDGAQYDDSTALIGCRISDGHLFTLGIWEKPEGARGWEVDRDAVDQAVEDAFERFDVLAMWPDPWGDWRSYVDRWSARWPGRVVEFDTRHKVKMCRALERVHADVTHGASLVKDGRAELRPLTHDGDPVTARHVANARRRDSGDLYAIGKDQRKSPRKIDAAVALSLAYAARSYAIEEGLHVKKAAGKVYSFR